MPAARGRIPLKGRHQPSGRAGPAVSPGWTVACAAFAQWGTDMLLQALTTARDLGRLQDILGVLIRHGFGDTVRRLGLADALEKAGHALR